MRQPRRFERKILLAIFAVGAFAIAGAIVFGGIAVREAYRVGVNRDVAAQLERGLDAYRRYYVAERERAAHDTAAIARDFQLRDALASGDAAAIGSALDAILEGNEDIVEIVLTRGDRSVRRSSRVIAREKPFKRETSLDDGTRIELTFAGPQIQLSEYQRAGQMVDVFARLERNTRYVTDTYVELYVAMLVVVILAAVIFAVAVSRRVTRRIALVAQAAKHVGAGDLSVSIPVDSTDEIAELTTAFNQMIADMKISRERIDYLQRIGAWQEFARRLAHEIKNPLTPIQLAIQEVHRRNPHTDAAYDRAIDDAKTIIEEEVATLRRLVGEFSSFAKLPDPQLESADLCEFASDAMRSLSVVHNAENSPKIELLAPSERVPVRIDTMMLKRCVDNLVTNAAQALRNARTPSPHITVQVQRTSKHAVIEVRDNGPGVPDGARARVFEPYFTTKAEGTGLGLAIVKKIILEHDGEIVCDRAPEGGACFRIRLPLVDKEAA